MTATVEEPQASYRSWPIEHKKTPIQTSKSVKVALLIGVSQYNYGLPSIPGAVEDIKAMEHILTSVEWGYFDKVISLPNPRSAKMRQTIEDLFTGRATDDLVLLFFSGHSLKTRDGELYLGAIDTRRQVNGEPAVDSAISASYIHNLMNTCSSQKQVIVLDSCFSGAFPEGMVAKGHITINSHKLAGRGRIILSSSSATQLSFGEESSSLSPYTRYLIEAIKQGNSSVREIHQYVSEKIQDKFPLLQPEFYSAQEGLDIIIAKSNTASNSNFLNHLTIIAYKIFSRHIALVKKFWPHLALAIASTILIYALACAKQRQQCKELQQKWMTGTKANGWVKHKYEGIPEDTSARNFKNFCESIGIPIDGIPSH